MLARSMALEVIRQNATWPFVLSQQFQRRAVNVAADAAIFCPFISLEQRLAWGAYSVARAGEVLGTAPNENIGMSAIVFDLGNNDDGAEDLSVLCPLWQHHYVVPGSNDTGAEIEWINWDLLSLPAVREAWETLSRVFSPSTVEITINHNDTAVDSPFTDLQGTFTVVPIADHPVDTGIPRNVGLLLLQGETDEQTEDDSDELLGDLSRAIAIESYTTNETLPFLVSAEFGIFAPDLLVTGNDEDAMLFHHIIFAPLVAFEHQAVWEEFSKRNSNALATGVLPEDIGGIFPFGGAATVLLPVWQHTPVNASNVNFNLMFIISLEEVVNRVLLSLVPETWIGGAGFLPGMDVGDERDVRVHPIIRESLSTPKRADAVLLAVMPEAPPTSSPTTVAPTSLPTMAPQTGSPTMTTAPQTSNPTSIAPTTMAPSMGPTTAMPTSVPITASPSTATTTSEPTMPPSTVSSGVGTSIFSGVWLASSVWATSCFW